MSVLQHYTQDLIVHVEYSAAALLLKAVWLWRERLDACLGHASKRKGSTAWSHGVCKRSSLVGKERMKKDVVVVHADLR
jgi:hypothetical protein